jgi:hypothetical protein
MGAQRRKEPIFGSERYAMYSKPLSQEYLESLRHEAKETGFLLCTQALRLLDEIARLRRALDASSLEISSAGTASDLSLLSSSESINAA